MEKVFSLITNENLFQNAKNIGVAVSGGVDSVALLHFLNNNKQKFNINVIALHFDHKIRKTSTKDRQFVQDFCVKNNIENTENCRKVTDPQNAVKSINRTIYNG